jgi:hypothetical protein
LCVAIRSHPRLPPHQFRSALGERRAPQHLSSRRCAHGLADTGPGHSGHRPSVRPAPAHRRPPPARQAHNPPHTRRCGHAGTGCSAGPLPLAGCPPSSAVAASQPRRLPSVASISSRAEALQMTCRLALGSASAGVSGMSRMTLLCGNSHRRVLRDALAHVAALTAAFPAGVPPPGGRIGSAGAVYVGFRQAAPTPGSWSDTAAVSVAISRSS